MRDLATDRVVMVMLNAQEGPGSGVGAYPGPEGYFTMQRIRNGSLTRLDEDELLETRALVCAFVPRSCLPRSGRRLLSDAGLVGRRGELVPGDLYRVRTPTDDEDPSVGAYSWESPDIGVIPDRATWAPDQVTTMRLERLSLRPEAAWEVATVTGAGVVQTSARDRPEIMLTLCVVDRGSGFVHYAEPIPAPILRAESPSRFAAALLHIGFRPERVLVEDFRLREQIAPVVQALGCKLRRVQRLSAMQELRSDLREFMRRRS